MDFNTEECEGICRKFHVAERGQVKWEIGVFVWGDLLGSVA
jgi:hypothetical protein